MGDYFINSGDNGNKPRPRRPISQVNLESGASGDLNQKDSKMQSTNQHWKLLANSPTFDTEATGPHVPLYTAPETENGEIVDSEETDILRIDGEKKDHFWTDLRQDYSNIAILLFLYTLQGIPLGLTASIPLILQNRHVSYHQQAVFSFAYWPFSLKLLWAPIVDALYWSRIGRRKSWLVPTQYLIGVFMLVLSTYVTRILGDDNENAKPDVLFLASIFFAFNFLAATQDIAVDGWALTMLSKRNLGYASTCNAVGQTAGYFLGNVVFLALESAEFCNKYLRRMPRNEGLVTLSDFVYFWAWIFMISTTLVLLFKRENGTGNNDVAESDALDNLGVVSTYKFLWDIIRLRPVLTLCGIHLTAKIAFAAADGITGLKLVELGVPKDKLAFIAIPLVPLQVILPWVLGKYTAGPRPLEVYLKAYPYRVAFGVVFALIVYWTPSWKQPDGHFPMLYYVMIVVIYCLYQVTLYSIFVACMAFHAQISDPLVGGTYMTLMNTVTNLGGNWPVTLALSVVDDLTWKECRKPDGLRQWLGPCASGEAGESSCTHSGGVCVTTVDGFYILSFVCAVVGFLWWKIMRRRVDRLHDVPKSEWSKSVNFSR